MDTFNDFYNRFIASEYGINILNYLFFIAAFFVIILVGVWVILLKHNKKNGNDANTRNYINDG